MIEAWLTALRSGEYQQGFIYYRQFDTYCAFGVFCDVIMKEKKIAWQKVPVFLGEDHGFYMIPKPDGGIYPTPPPFIREQYQDVTVPFFWGTLKVDRGMIEWANDILKMSFMDIASLVEAAWQKK